jgi:hypothetical protein
MDVHAIRFLAPPSTASSVPFASVAIEMDYNRRLGLAVRVGRHSSFVPAY